MAGLMTNIQSLGRTLMLPIAVLPVAGLLLRFGQPDLLDIPFIAASGAAIFSNLGLIFAIGVAIGFAKENNGAAGLAGAVCYFVATSGAKTLIGAPPEIAAAFTDAAAKALADAAYLDKEIGKLSVPIGILSGIISGVLYNRYHNIKLPEFLAFFGGRRFVPIAAGCAGVVVAALFGLGWTHIEGAMDTLSRGVVASGEVGLFLYGVLNRVLIVTGLHHILNNVAWFLIGDYNGVTGDLNRFFAGDPQAGSFMSGFFPVMMFGLPAACLAMYHAAPSERRAQVGGMYLSLGLTSLLTGVTEPIEFTFMFLAPALYAVHALLTGLAMVLMDVLGVKLGFGFSAGLIDYVLNFNKSTRPLLLLPVGIAYAALYY
ncbi:MAG: PTS transporter subunit EIIC, partial [Amphiplicatus sp.]